ncbi:MAG: LytTR family transcriptional regulator DNA-binding domain-containing protein [Bacteroidota bacterium]
MSTISVSITGELSYKEGNNVIFFSAYDVVYAEYQDDRCTVFLSNRATHTICCQLKEILECKPTMYILVNRNVLINMKFIRIINKSHVVLAGNIEIDTSIRKHRTLLKTMQVKAKNDKKDFIKLHT